ncbi:MAG TPA: hypothetical protein VKZ63_10605, partial [Kofleriaceae bacterium]|nr:hypothetical protein [Kofleriaceae bacterium]
MRSTSFRLLLLALVACDPSARTEARGAGSGDHRSQEHETCARSADCASGLRCFDGTCRRTDQSVLGELHASIGDRALTSGDAAEAAEAYGAAVAQYEKEKLAPPADLLCAQGRAILQERG